MEILVREMDWNRVFWRRIITLNQVLFANAWMGNYLRLCLVLKKKMEGKEDEEGKKKEKDVICLGKLIERQIMSCKKCICKRDSISWLSI